MGGTTLERDATTAPPLPPDHPAPPGLGPRRVRLVFLALMLVPPLAALEQMIVATALPRIVGELPGVDRMSWAITAYLLTATVGLPVHGNLGDLLGRKASSSSSSSCRSPCGPPGRPVRTSSSPRAPSCAARCAPTAAGRCRTRA
ncbi:hypothetical protein [Streptomyces sp. bgisy159]|uniref:hypothetical protein n=1 Tax=Streptomyces sp. bgisy159 TaxID=3413795 RepID=UPI003F4A2FC6